MHERKTNGHLKGFAVALGMVVTVDPGSVFMWGWGGARTPCGHMNALRPTPSLLRWLRAD